MDKEQFLRRHPDIIGNEKLKKYAVFIPFLRIAGETCLLFEKRSSKLRRQPGEICFPGGKLEKGESFCECAIRETMEELLLLESQLEVLGPGDIYLSPFQLIIHPFIGRIHDYQDTFQRDEVEEIIKVPLDFLLSYQPHRFESKLTHELPEDFPYDWIPGGIKYPWSNGTYEILFYQYEDWIIWGMTAQILRSALSLIREFRME